MNAAMSKADQDEVIDSPKRIVRALDKAALEEELIEVQINRRTRIFYSQVRDHLPPLIEREEDGETKMVEPPYEPRSYLDKAKYFLIEPLVPALGNVQVRTAEKVLFRFFQGVKAVEAEVDFLGIEQVRGEPTIKLSFPEEMTVLRKRRHFRAKVEEELEFTAFIEKEVQEEKEGSAPVPPMPVKTLDLSVGGFSFCTAFDADVLPVDQKLVVTLKPLSGGADLLFSGYVRNMAKATPKEGCGSDVNRCGVQFDIPTEQTALRLEELVAEVQRVHIQMLQEKKAGEAAFTKVKKEKKDKSGGMGEIGKFFKAKKKLKK